MAGVALAGDIEIPVLVLREPLQPVNQERVVVFSRALVPVGFVIRRRIRVRESNSRW